VRVLNAHRVGLDPLLAGTAALVDRTTAWGNRFRIGPDGSRACVVEKHRLWLPTQPHLMARLHELVGKDLLCWCAPHLCHADNILELILKLWPVYANP
jgi:hypothetical protein